MSPCTMAKMIQMRIRHFCLEKSLSRRHSGTHIFCQSSALVFCFLFLTKDDYKGPKTRPQRTGSPRAQSPLCFSLKGRRTARVRGHIHKEFQLPSTVCYLMALHKYIQKGQQINDSSDSVKSCKQKETKKKTQFVWLRVIGIKLGLVYFVYSFVSKNKFGTTDH